MGSQPRVKPLSSRFDERLLLAYVALAPVLVFHVSGQPFGAVDLLAPLGILALLRGPHTMQLQVVLFWTFLISLLAGSAYLLMSGQANVTDMDILRIIRVMCIFIPFLLVLQMQDFSRIFMLRLMRVFLWSGSIACLIAIVLLYLNIKVRDTQQMNWSDGDASLRAGGLLGNSSDVGHIAAILGTVAIGYRVLNPAYGRAYIFPLGIALYTAYVSSSRAAVLQLVVALFVLMPLLFRKRRIFMPFFALPFITGLIIVNWDDIKAALGTNFMARRFDILNLTGDSTFFSVNSRLDSWNRSWELFGESPFVGVGYNGIYSETGRSGDNSFISILTEGGLIAGSAYVLLWISIVWAILRSSEIRTRLVGLAMVSAEIAQMLTVDTHRQPTTTAVVLALIACLMRVGAMEANTSPSPPESNQAHTALPTSGPRGKPAAPRPVAFP